MNRILVTILIILLSCMSFSFPCLGQNSSIENEYWDDIFDPPFKTPTELSKGKPLRKELLNIFRPIVMNETNKPVLFYGSLKSYKNWVFFMGSVLDKNGKSIGFPPMDNSDSIALWLRTYKGWTLVDYSIGHSDMFWDIWHYKYGVPLSLLGF
jgi:hypothetical protein